MRVVAKVQITSDGPDGRIAASSAIDRWSESKFNRDADGNLTIARSGADALIERVDDTAPDYSQTRYSMLEPVDGGSLQTEVRIVSTPDRTVVSTVLSLSSDFGVAPLNIALRAPKFIRAIVDGTRNWTVGVGGERVFASSLRAGEQNLIDLLTLIEFESRRLPIVIVSEYDGKTLAGDLDALLAADLCGLAHIVRLDTQGAWELTKQWGAEWSCYNGAVRLMWPMRGGRGDPRAHPLWTADRIMLRTHDQAVARDRLRHDIGRRILEASTYVPDDSALADFAKVAARDAADKARAAAAHSPSQSKQAYEEQIRALRDEIDRKDAEIRTQTENVQSLSIALRTMRPDEDGAAQDQLDLLETEPQSVSEAVATARKELAGKIDIANETNPHVADLNPEAGPPEKILRYLRTLGDLADRLAEGPLGLSVPKWLEERNVECSGDSETAKNSKSGKKFRVRPVNGQEVDCEFHVKPSEGTSPDRCARIYFGISNEAPHVLIGYIGRHIA